MNNVLVAIGILVAVVGLTFVISIGLDKSERVECEKLVRYSTEYAPAFYITEWQDEMCRAHDIVIDAPVK